MAKQIKKASLLSEAEKQKLLKKAGSKKPISQPQTGSSFQSVRTTSVYATNSSEEDQTKVSSRIPVKACVGLVAILLTAFMVVPKPQLLEYQSAGLVTQSIYMPGWFGKPGTILDTNQRAILAEEEQSLYLCFEGQSNEQCARYQLRKEQGLVAAAMFWYSSRP